jgi:tRNA pseudouridine(55) synthase
MNKVLNLYKQAGETPLECILRFKKINPEYENVKMTYAGRLDPLAEGVLLVLTGEEVYNKEMFLNLKKEYEVEVLFGFETDTFDILGLLKSEIRSTKSETNSKSKIQNFKKELTNFAVVSLGGYLSARPEADELRRGRTSFQQKTMCDRFVNSDDRSLWRNNVEEALKKFVGKNIFEYPPYSSKTVNGKPLFSFARSGELDDIEIPKREIEIFNLEIIDNRKINSKDLLKDIEEKINKVKGDFRQEIIISKWREVLEKNDTDFQIIKIRAEVSSGTYMRTLAYEWGKALGVSALAYHIKRTRVAEFVIV